MNLTKFDRESVYSFGNDDEELTWAEQSSDARGADSGFTGDAVGVLLEPMFRTYQRHFLSASAGVMVGGAMAVSPVVGDRPVTKEKRFTVSRLMNWDGGDVEGFLAEMKSGRLVTRLAAPTGSGKTLKFPSRLAVDGGLRVCLVVLDARVARDVCEWNKESGVRVRKHWSKVKQEWLTVMTYANFYGVACSADRRAFFRDFDVFCFDESMVRDKYVELSKHVFSAFATEHNSLVMMSATVSEDPSELRVNAKQGVFQTASVKVSVEEAMQSGKLLEFPTLTDRTLVLVASDTDTWDLKAYYEEYGVEVYSLDSASTWADVEAVRLHLSGDASIERVVVAHELFGISYNLPVRNVVTFAERSEWVVEGNRFVERKWPLDAAMILQHKGRSGRGIVDGSGGFVLSPEVDQTTGLYDSHEMAVFVGLFAASIEPLKVKWKGCWERLPRGLTREAAYKVMLSTLPVEVVLRYLGRDGKVARKYCAALSMFVQPGHYLYPSVDEEPADVSSWVEECVGGYDDTEDQISEVKVKVPLVSSGRMKVAMHSLYVLANGMMKGTRWRPSHVDVSSDDEIGTSTVVGRRRQRGEPRQIRDVEPMFRPVAVAPRKQVGWKLETESAGEPVVHERRFGRDWTATPRGRAAIAALDAVLDRYGEETGHIPNGVLESEQPGLRDVELAEPMGAVQSPGGREICQLPVDVCRNLNEGKSLEPEKFVDLVQTVQGVADRFVASQLFDCYAGPWDSLLDSLLDERVVDVVKSDGVYPQTYRLVAFMSERFRRETVEVFANSNVYKRRFFRVFAIKAPTSTQLFDAIRRGSFNSVAQTDGFIARVKTIKQKMDNVLLMADQKGLYLPVQITRAQRVMPVQGGRVFGGVGENLSEMPDAVRRYLRGGGRRNSKELRAVNVHDPYK